MRVNETNLSGPRRREACVVQVKVDCIIPARIARYRALRSTLSAGGKKERRSLY